MTSNASYFGALNAPQEVRDRRLVLDEGTPSGPLPEAIRPENTGIRWCNWKRSLMTTISRLVIADLCSKYLSKELIIPNFSIGLWDYSYLLSHYV